VVERRGAAHARRKGRNMAKKVFLSFHYERDAWRVQQVANMGEIDEQAILDEQAWEEVKQGGDTAIKKWIADKISGKNCLVCLIGNQTADREWVQYEIEKAWNDGKGVVGIYIHNLKSAAGSQDSKGSNPLGRVSVEINGSYRSLSGIAKDVDPTYTTSTYVYDWIKENIEGLIDQAITIRNGY